MSYLLGAVELANVLHDLEAPLIVEVHIDIGHLGTLRGQEPLEHQAVLERVERGDVHGVGDDSAGGRATAGADADAIVLGPLHVLGNNQKVGGKALSQMTLYSYSKRSLMLTPPISRVAQSSP